MITPINEKKKKSTTIHPLPTSNDYCSSWSISSCGLEARERADPNVTSSDNCLEDQIVKPVAIAALISYIACPKKALLIHRQNQFPWVGDCCVVNCKFSLIMQIKNL